MESAFCSAKDVLGDATMLAHPQAAAPLLITSDMLDRAVGGSLEQQVDGTSQPLGFF